MDHTSASASSTITTSIPILTVRLGDKGTKESLYWNFVFRGGACVWPHQQCHHQIKTQQCLRLGELVLDLDLP